MHTRRNTRSQRLRRDAAQIINFAFRDTETETLIEETYKNIHKKRTLPQDTALVSSTESKCCMSVTTFFLADRTLASPNVCVLSRDRR